MKKVYILLLLAFSAQLTIAQSWSITGNNGINSSNFIGTTDNRSLIFKTNNVKRGSLFSSGIWNLGASSDYAKIDSSGKLSFVGRGTYLVGNNKYVFQYASNPHYGLFYNSSKPQYELRDSIASPVFYVNANNGNGMFRGTLRIGTYTLPATDGISGQVLATDGKGKVNWVMVDAGANASLSNLTATAVSRSLIPKTNDTLSLGSSSLRWKNIYFGGDVYYSNQRFISAKNNNVFVGSGAGKNTTGYSNIAIGINALYKNTIGTHLVAIGDSALFNQNGGSGHNIAIGSKALYYNTTGNGNAATGSSALYHNTTGSVNTATGIEALYYNTTGSVNTATGFQALCFNTTGFNNTATGYWALYTNTKGSENTATGVEALYYNTTGSENTATGRQALWQNTKGNQNTANGYGSLLRNTTGSENTAGGGYALINNTTGSGNTAIGTNALNYNITGSRNTALGYYANVNEGNFTNCTVIGYEAFAMASNQVRIGNSDVKSIGGQVDWTTLSDGRVKKNIKQNVPGLAFINKLRPITYNLDLDAVDKIIQRPVLKTKDGNAIQPLAEDLVAHNERQQIIYTGFIAQDVEKAAKELSYDFSGVDAAKNDKDLYGLRYAEFVVPLVKAVQELSKQNDSLKMALYAQGENFQKQIDELKALLVSNANQSSPNTQITTVLTSASLEQNIPNPFTNTTTIGYTIPQKFAFARLVITDKTGRQIKQINITTGGKGILHVDASTLSSGAYNYTLYVDGKLISSKQMVLTK
ncbi:MAG: tail fiber domain-containing protein [Parafilimonas sp.]